MGEGPRALLLDVDDTLVATFATGLEKFRLLAEQVHRPAPTAADLIAAGYGSSTFEECLAALFAGSDLRSLARAYDDLADAVPPRPLGDVAGLVLAARDAGWFVGVLTNGPRHKTTRKLAVCGVVDLLDGVVCADDLPLRKPDPTAFRAACSALDIDPRRTWYASDSPADWWGAEAAGLHSIGVLHGRPVGEAVVVPPRLTIAEVTALVPLLPALAGVRSGDALRAPRAVTFDVGDTLCLPVASPSQLLGTGADGPRVDAALAAGVGALGPEHWVHDGSNREALREVWGAGSLAAAAIVESALDAFVASGNWRAMRDREEVVSTIAALGMRVGVVSNWQASLPAVLAAALPDVAFDAIVSSCAIGVAKPAAGAFLAAAAGLGVSIGELVHVGDSPVNDVAGAMAAGARAVFVRPEDDMTDLTALASGRPRTGRGLDTVRAEQQAEQQIAEMETA